MTSNATPAGAARPDFATFARDWLDQHVEVHTARQFKVVVTALAVELRRVWELGIANAIEIVDAAEYVDPVYGWIDPDNVIEGLRELIDKPTGGKE